MTAPDPRAEVFESVQAANIARRQHAAAMEQYPDPATRVLDAMGREWARMTNGAWGCLGNPITVDSYAVLVARYGPTEVLA